MTGPNDSDRTIGFSANKPFCYSCGAAHPGDDSPCECGSSRQEPGWEPNSVGSVFRLTGPLKRTGVVIKRSSEVTFLLGPQKTKAVSRSSMQSATRIIDMSSVPSELFRLESLTNRSEKWAQGLAVWLAEEGVSDSFLDTLTSKRRYARSAIAAGNFDDARKSGLSESELVWLEMHAHLTASRIAKAADAALRLPPAAYPDKIDVLAIALAHSDWSPSGEQVEAVMRIPATAQGSDLIRIATGASSTPEDWESVRSALRLYPKANETLWMRALVDADPQGLPHLLASSTVPADHGRHGRPSMDRGLKERLKAAADSSYEFADRSLDERLMAAAFGARANLSVEDVLTLHESSYLSFLDDLMDAEANLGSRHQMDEIGRCALTLSGWCSAVGVSPAGGCLSS